MALMTKTTQSEFVTLTVDDLTKAIRNSIKNDVRSMPEEEAKEMAQHVMNFFGYSERIIDNILEPEDRDAFYMLEDSGLLTTEREETTLYDGREWRIHYWIFKKDKILDLVKTRGRKLDPIVEEAMSVYEEIPDDVWRITEKPDE
jgi:transcription initiation factor IIE alpha subunit